MNGYIFCFALCVFVITRGIFLLNRESRIYVFSDMWWSRSDMSVPGLSGWCVMTFEIALFLSRLQSRMVALIWSRYRDLASLPSSHFMGVHRQSHHCSRRITRGFVSLWILPIGNGWCRWFHRVIRGGKWVNVAVFGSLINRMTLCD